MSESHPEPERTTTPPWESPDLSEGEQGLLSDILDKAKQIAADMHLLREVVGSYVTDVRIPTALSPAEKLELAAHVEDILSGSGGQDEATETTVAEDETPAVQKPSDPEGSMPAADSPEPVVSKAESEVPQERTFGIFSTHMPREEAIGAAIKHLQALAQKYRNDRSAMIQAYSDLMKDANAFAAHQQANRILGWSTPGVIHTHFLQPIRSYYESIKGTLKAGTPVQAEAPRREQPSTEAASAGDSQPDDTSSAEGAAPSSPDTAAASEPKSAELDDAPQADVPARKRMGRAATWLAGSWAGVKVREAWDWLSKDPPSPEQEELDDLIDQIAETVPAEELADKVKEARKLAGDISAHDWQADHSVNDDAIDEAVKAAKLRLGIDTQA